MKIIIAYIPVWCRGYENFLENNPDARRVYVLGRSITSDFRPLEKDLRALDPYEVQRILRSKGIYGSLRVLENFAENIFEGVTHVVMPDEDVSREIAKNIPPDIDITFDNSIFLRWDQTSAKKHKEVESARFISADSFFKKANALLVKEAEQSPDLWRQVAGMIFDEGGISMIQHNRCVPNFERLFFTGDPRGQFQKGEHVDLSIFEHSEAWLIAEAARRGLALEGKSIFVTTFPCPPCGKLIASSGIKKLYFKDGYAVLDSEEVLVDKGVAIFKVLF